MKKIIAIIVIIIVGYHFYPKGFLEKPLYTLYQNPDNISLAQLSISKEDNEYVNDCSFAQRYLYAEARSNHEANCANLDTLLDNQQPQDIANILSHVSGRVFIDYVIKQQKIQDSLPPDSRDRN